MASICVTVFNDPGCPWGYCAIPALRTLEWRYGAQLDWRLVLIGLSDDPQQYVERGYTPVSRAIGQLDFRRFGMPFSIAPKSRVTATAPACRVIAAARIAAPGSEWRVLRALQQANFTSGLLIDEVDGLRAVLDRLDDIDTDAVLELLDSAQVDTAYQGDYAEARTAAVGPGALQGKTANTDGLERHTAPSVIFERAGQRLEATGFQPIEAYDVLVANLDPTLDRRGPAASALEVLTGLAQSPHGADVTTVEVAQIMAAGNDPIDLRAAERELLQLVGDGRARRVALGDGATWVATA